MFGYVQANVPELKIKEYAVYRSYYCGLCESLRVRYGRLGQLCLSYDMTFLALLLTGLYEPEEQVLKKRCPVHPARPRTKIMNEAVDYAADMTMLLSYHKAKDDWKDEHSLKGRAVSSMLESVYRELKEQYPRQTRALERSIRGLDRYESGGVYEPDRVSSATGAFLAQIYNWKHDEWGYALRRLGFSVGKFVYLMDAWDDLPEDLKKGRYNVFKALYEEDPEHFDEKARRMLTDTITPGAQAFEYLPILKNAQILRNILYGGVWVKYAQGRAKQKVRSCGHDDADLSIG